MSSSIAGVYIYETRPITQSSKSRKGLKVRGYRALDSPFGQERLSSRTTFLSPLVLNKPYRGSPFVVLFREDSPKLFTVSTVKPFLTPH